ncbi:MAG: class I SAM-dependent methyltransferase [Spirochaetales bacterium]|nr:class I SAM-dependent methyltransferase [Spirochaetales bacterium]
MKKKVILICVQHTAIKAVIKKRLKRIPIIGAFILYVYNTLKIIFNILEKISFPGSVKYWEKRYVNRGTSGTGSYGKLARFKADVINLFVKENRITSIVELGCGDGNQLAFLKISRYVGLDVSATAIKLCIDKFKHDAAKSFFLYDPHCFKDNHNIFQADCAVSLDVIYHLVEDSIFEQYMKDLFSCAAKFVIIYSSNSIDRSGRFSPYYKNRLFTRWIERNLKNWKCIKEVKNKYPDESPSDFYIYKKMR